MADLKGALEELNSSITSITDKVNGQKAIIASYKEKLLAKLGDLVNQIQQLKDSPALASIPQLKQQLQQIPQLQEQLRKKSGELEVANEQLNELKIQIEGFNADIESRNKQIRDLEQKMGEKDGQISGLNDQVKTLTDEKTTIQNQLTAKTAEMNDLVTRIGQINAYLLQQIGLIDTITAELGDLDSGNIADQFQAISTNIQSIVNMINNPGTGGAEAIPPSQPNPYPFYNKFVKLPEQQKIEILQNLGGEEYASQIENDLQNLNESKKNNINNILMRRYKGDLLKGGKSRCRTMKKHHKRTHKKMRGGYIYSSSKELDKASSVISASSGSKSTSSKSSNSKSKRKDKTRRKSMK
jgi:predicted  nucleic acid-binding Zn-ribbon protein